MRYLLLLMILVSPSAALAIDFRNWKETELKTDEVISVCALQLKIAPRYVPDSKTLCITSGFDLQVFRKKFHKNNNL